jgi:hypothetical protein
MGAGALYYNRNPSSADSNKSRIHCCWHRAWAASSSVPTTIGTLDVMVMLQRCRQCHNELALSPTVHGDGPVNTPRFKGQAHLQSSATSFAKSSTRACRRTKLTAVAADPASC